MAGPNTQRERALAFWRALLSPTDVVIDATCGNGKDTLELAKLVPQGKVYSLDIQKVALQRARETVSTSLYPHVFFLLQSHATLPEMRAKLIVYNLGYLPGSDKSITTQTATTLLSLDSALRQAEALSIMCYPGHPEGKRETAAVLGWARTLEGVTLSIYPSEREGPLLVTIQKS